MSTISPGAFLQQRITEMSRKVAKSNNTAGYVAMWPEAVNEVLAKFPNLSPAEKMACAVVLMGKFTQWAHEPSKISRRLCKQ